MLLEFEKPLIELESKIEELRALSRERADVRIEEEIERLERRAKELCEQLYSSLTPWQKTQVARHPERPHFADYIEGLFEDFTPLAGDRRFAEDSAIIGGMARFRSRPVMLVGHEKGRDTSDRLEHNFGMAMPEGYRKAARLMTLADRFAMPVIALVDTPGAYPGVGAEQRGQAEAIARCTECCLSLSVPNIAVITGEGGSGGAVALATANRVLMLEHGIYTVASPEACASILWRSAEKAEEAAAALKITAESLLQLGVIDAILKEPRGGAHRLRSEMIASVGEAIEESLLILERMNEPDIQKHRREKFLRMGRGSDMAAQAVGL